MVYILIPLHPQFHAVNNLYETLAPKRTWIPSAGVLSVPMPHGHKGRIAQFRLPASYGRFLRQTIGLTKAGMALPYRTVPVWQKPNGAVATYGYGRFSTIHSTVQRIGITKAGIVMAAPYGSGLAKAE